MENDLITVDEKIHMTTQFIRNLMYSRYNVELSLLAENAVENPNQNNVDSFTGQLAEIDHKIAALNDQLTLLEGQ